MTEEYIYQRERDLLDYFRNNLTDPESRGVNTTDTFTATAIQTIFTLKNNLVKNVADTITVNAVTKYKGSDYTVTYGEGKKPTTVTLTSTATVGWTVVIGYHYGESMIEREYSRTDVKLPRIVIMFLTGSEGFAALGDYVESTLGSYFNVSYRIEIRSKYATQARELSSQAFNLCKKMRHASLFRTNVTRPSALMNFDYDREKESYVWQFTVDIQYEIMFQ